MKVTNWQEFDIEGQYPCVDLLCKSVHDPLMLAQDRNRLRTAMVLFTFEKTLGEFVKNQASGSPETVSKGAFKKIAEREQISTELPFLQRVTKSVAASYIEELFNLAREVTNESSLHDSLSRLSQLANALDLFTVRNAVSHPNREFPESYWYRVAALASDPLIDRLGFLEVKQSLQAAEDNKIVAPPEEWLQHVFSAIPNNLPREFEHEVTGLIGRKKEKGELLAYLRGDRYHLISVVAPGGLGKTALTLDALRDCALDPDTHTWCDGIVFISLRQEQLTAEGIKIISAAQTIDELKAQLVGELSSLFPATDYTDFQKAVEYLAAERLLICIDNLETLLRDNPEAFSAFYETFPKLWRVVLTSRITVDGAKTMTLGTLTTDGARALVYKYFSSKGVSMPSGFVVEQLLEGTSQNPLAIRLTIDRYANGYPVLEATKSAEKDVVAFSFKNLIETLSENSIVVLEALFVKDDFSRADLLDTLNVSFDAAAEAIKQLTSTSLVVRTNDENVERLSLSPSVRDLLRDNPRNLQVRTRVRKQIDLQAREIRKHYSIQKQYNYSSHSADFIPNDTPPTLSAILVNALRIIKAENPAHSQVVAVLDRLEQVIQQYRTNALAHLTLGRLYLLANDDANAEGSFRNALELETHSPSASMVLLYYYLERSRPEEAVACAEDLCVKGWGKPENSDEFVAGRIWSGYFRALSDTGQFDEIIRLANRVSGSPGILSNAQISKANAIIRKVGSLHSLRPDIVLGQLEQAATNIKTRPSESYLSKFWAATCRLLCREMKHLIENMEIVESNQITIFTILSDLEPVVAECHTSRYKADLPSLIHAFRTVDPDAANNPFTAEKWDEYDRSLRATPTRVAEFTSDGFIIVSVYKVPSSSDRAAYVFAENGDGDRFFVPWSSYLNPNPLDWERIEVGTVLAIRSINPPNSVGSYPVPDETFII